MEANPETLAELKKTYVDLESLTNTGLDSVAEAMNSGGNLATAELNKSYAQAKEDTQNMLQEQTKAFAEAQAEVSKQFAKDMAEAEKTRDTAIAEAHEAYAEAIAAVNKDLQDSIAEVKKDLADALAEASAALAEAQSEARKELSDDLAAIQKDFEDKLGKIDDATKKTIAAIELLKTAMAEASALTIAPITPAVTPIDPLTGLKNDTITSQKPEFGVGGQPIYTTVNAYTNASPQAIADAATNSAKFGLTVAISNKINSMGSAAFE